MNPGEKDLGSKKEEEDLEGFNTKFPKLPPSSSSRQWASTFKNPRIVRVSRTFGGKDRHSKVCTVRGLRDRRIRLSVPTAIQLYDLQERLGLTQPSKVIDWLLEATKQEIDKLPPLPMIPANFLQQPPSLLPFANPNLDPNPSIPYNVPEFLSPNMFKERERWGVGPHHDHQGNHGEQNFFPLNNSNHHFSVPNLAYNPSFFHLEPQNLTLSQFGGGFSFSRSDDRESSNLSSSSRASSSQQVYMAESAAHFPPYFAPSLESDHFRQINNLQSHNSSLHFSDSPMKSFSLNASLPLTEEENQEKSNTSS